MNDKVQVIIKEAILKCAKPPINVNGTIGAAVNTAADLVSMFMPIPKPKQLPTLDTVFNTAYSGTVWMEMVNKIAAEHNINIIGYPESMIGTIAAGVSGYFARRLPAELREGMTNIGLVSEGLADFKDLLANGLGASKETINYLNAYSTYVFGKKLDETLAACSGSSLDSIILQRIAEAVQKTPSRDEIAEFETFSSLSARDFR